MTLWDIVTGNSTLAVSPANTFWDHLNNQQGGGGVTETVFIHYEPITDFYDEGGEATVEFTDGDYEVIYEDYDTSVEVLSDEDAVQFFDDEVIVYVTP